MANEDGQPVAITGMGLATALGLGADETWRAILAGRCGSGPMRGMEQPLPGGCDGCQAPDLPADYEPSLPREARYLRWTIQAALRDAGAGDARSADPSRCALMLGTTLHGMRAGGRFFRSENCAELRDFLAGDTLRRAT
ncbi:MAG: beta-ketoacyl synthase N-terminal-like domain-containing protein, partial [Tepidisphaeraceae bacterium]